MARYDAAEFLSPSEYADDSRERSTEFEADLADGGRHLRRLRMPVSETIFDPRLPRSIP